MSGCIGLLVVFQVLGSILTRKYGADSKERRGVMVGTLAIFFGIVLGAPLQTGGLKSRPARLKFFYTLPTLILNVYQ